MKQSERKRSLRHAFSQILAEYNSKLSSLYCAFLLENLKEQFDSFEAGKSGTEFDHAFFIKLLGNYFFYSPNFNACGDDSKKANLIYAIKFMGILPGVKLPPRHHILDKWMKDGVESDSLLEILADHGCEGPCPACRVGEVEHHMCKKCHAEFCPQCHGIISNHHHKYIKECNCKD